MPSHEAAAASTVEIVTVTSVNSIKSGKVKAPDRAPVIVIRKGGAGAYGKFRNTQLIAESLSVLLETVSNLPNATEVLRLAVETVKQNATALVPPNADKVAALKRRPHEGYRQQIMRTAYARRYEVRDSVDTIVVRGNEHFLTQNPKSLLEQKMASPIALRSKVFDSTSWLTSAEVSHNAGFTSTNKAAAANKWKKAGEIFSLPKGGKDMFPSYIFDDDGRPLSCIKDILMRLGKSKSQLAIAAWFASKNSWLGGKAPMDMLKKDPEAVINAAAMEGAPSEHG